MPKRLQGPHRLTTHRICPVCDECIEPGADVFLVEEDAISGYPALDDYVHVGCAADYQTSQEDSYDPA